MPDFNIQQVFALMKEESREGIVRAFRLKIQSVRPRKNDNKNLLPNRLVGRTELAWQRELPANLLT
jgi:hypothetical protein